MICNVDKGILNARYEELRDDVLNSYSKNERKNQGIVLVLRQGMIGWLRVPGPGARRDREEDRTPAAADQGVAQRTKPDEQAGQSVARHSAQLKIESRNMPTKIRLMIYVHKW